MKYAVFCMCGLCTRIYMMMTYYYIEESHQVFIHLLPFSLYNVAYEMSQDANKNSVFRSLNQDSPGIIIIIVFWILTLL